MPSATVEVTIVGAVIGGFFITNILSALNYYIFKVYVTPSTNVIPVRDNPPNDSGF